MSLLNSKIDTIDDSETSALVRELTAITGVNPEAFKHHHLLHFFQQCLFPNGSACKPVKISKEDLDTLDPFDECVLRRKIGKLGPALYWTFKQLNDQTPHNHHGIEHFNGTAVYMFLNKMLVPVKAKRNLRFFKG